MTVRKQARKVASNRPTEEAMRRCPVLPLAVEYAALTAQFDKLEKEYPEDINTPDATRQIEDQKAAIREMASFLVPQTLAGAAFIETQQFAAFNVLSNTVFDNKSDQERYERRIARYGHNLLRWFKANGADLSTLVWQYDTTID